MTKKLVFLNLAVQHHLIYFWITFLVITLTCYYLSFIDCFFITFKYCTIEFKHVNVSISSEFSLLLSICIKVKTHPLTFSITHSLTGHEKSEYLRFDH